MFVGIIGLGMAGASMAKAIKLKTEHRVLGYDKDSEINIKAKLLRVVDDTLGFDNIGECSVLILALSPNETLNFIREYSSRLTGCEAVIDLCGIKKPICDEAFKLAAEYGYTFIGAHPMAEGLKKGFDNSKPSFYDGTSIVLTPSYDTSIQVLDMLKKLFMRIGFANIEISTPIEHDRIAAYTSQLTRIISSAYIKSQTAREHYGISAESYESFSKFSLLDEKMWAETLLANKEYVENELTFFIDNLNKYLSALKEGNVVRMRSLLEEGKKCKEYVDSKKDALIN